MRKNENAGEKKLRISFQSVRSKVIAGFLLAGASLVLFWLGSRFVFGVALQRMETMGQPDEKLARVHELFQEFTRVELLQRQIALKDQPGRRDKIAALSDTLHAHIADLKELYRTEDGQFRRLDSIEELTLRHLQLFQEFIRERDRLLSNVVMAEETLAISELIAAGETRIDSGLTATTYRQTSRTMQPPDTVVRIITQEPQGGFFNRLFGRTKPAETEEFRPAAEFGIVVEESVDSVVNQLSLAQRETVLPAVEERLRSIMQKKEAQASRAARAELEFFNASRLLAGEIRFLLHEIEEAEFQKIESERSSLTALIHSSFETFNWLLIGILTGLAFLVFLILTDFARSRRFRSQLVEARNEAERLSRVKERFLSNMSHEIRTPLQSIIGFAEQIENTERPSPADKRAIRQSAGHLLQIVNEIMDYNRLVSGRFQLEPRPFHLRETLSEVCAVMRVQAEKKGLAFVTETGSIPEVHLHGDAFRLRQILYNLLGNAVKFTEQGQVALRVETREEGDGVRCEFRVEDSGIGIPPESLESVFNQFEQAPGVDRERFGGAGLGLSIVKELVELQGGGIQAWSEPGKGARFTATLRYPKAEEAPVSDEIKQRQAAPAAAAHTGTIFVADDDPLTLRLCEKILRAAHFKTRCFPSASSLLENAGFRETDLVITDIRLPGMTGYELLEKLRESCPRIAVLAMTAQALPEEREAIRKAGFDDILLKPFTAAGLTRMAGRFVKPDPVFEDDELRELFIGESKKDLAAIASALEKNETSAAADAIHRLAGRCGQFGFTDWYQPLRALEIRLRRGERLDACREEIATRCAALSESMAEL
jgi:signal transduction histidine kinase/CheY-like chemotaxis protein